MQCWWIRIRIRPFKMGGSGFVYSKKRYRSTVAVKLPHEQSFKSSQPAQYPDPTK
jgi:hypothetical protein